MTVVSNVELSFPSSRQAEGGGDIGGLFVVLGGRNLDTDRLAFAENVEFTDQRLVKSLLAGGPVGRSTQGFYDPAPVPANQADRDDRRRSVPGEPVRGIGQ